MTATLVDRDAAIEALDRTEGWLYLATKALSEPAFAALFVPNADPMHCVAKLNETVKALGDLRRAFQRVRPHP